MRRILILVMIILISLVFSFCVNAEEPIVLKKEFTTVTPNFMQGHMGDQNWIKGYTLVGDIFLNETKIGTVNGEVTMLNPPVDMTQRYAEAFMIINNTVTNLGTFQVFAQVKSITTNDAITTGEGSVAWHGTIVNGSDQLQGLGGLSAGVVNYNVFTGQGSGTELLNINF